MKNILAVILCCFIYDAACSQNIVIQQNNPKQTEKVIVREKEVPVYIKEKKTSAPTEPICLHGYLWVYPEDLGRFTTYPAAVIAAINKSSAYGRNNWRLPTLEELVVLQQNVDKLGSVLWSRQMTDFYMHRYLGDVCCCDTHIVIKKDNDFAYGIRLVSTD